MNYEINSIYMVGNIKVDIHSNSSSYNLNNIMEILSIHIKKTHSTESAERTRSSQNTMKYGNYNIYCTFQGSKKKNNLKI